MSSAIVSFAGPLLKFFVSVNFLFFLICSIPFIGSTALIKTASPQPFLEVTMLKQWYMP